MAGLEWYPCCRLKPATQIPLQPNHGLLPLEEVRPKYAIKANLPLNKVSQLPSITSDSKRQCSYLQVVITTQVVKPRLGLKSKIYQQMSVTGNTNWDFPH